MANKKLNISISEDAHKVIELYKIQNDLVRKDDAVDKLLLEFAKLKKISLSRA